MLRSIFIAILLMSYSAFAVAQHCPLSKVKNYTLSNYDKKGKLASEIICKLTPKNGAYIVEIGTVTDNEVTEMKAFYEISCKDGKVEMSMADIDAPQLSGIDVQVNTTLESGSSDTPLNLYVGQQLEDQTMLDIELSGLVITKTYSTFNTKVEKKETLTTPAGEFECYLITSESLSTTGDLFKKKTSSKQWFCPAIGLAVRMESYNKKGKLMGYSEVTILNN